MREFDLMWAVEDETKILVPLRWRKSRIVRLATDLFADFVPDEWIDRVFAVMALRPQHKFQVLTKRAERMRAYFEARREGDPWAEAADEIADLMGLEEHPSVLEPTDIPLRNVWLGVSAEDQPNADERIPHLLATPAAVRFLSAEPLLGPIDILKHLVEEAPKAYQMLSQFYGPNGFDGSGSQPGRPHRRIKPCPLNWVICGGESGPHARPMHPDWARNLRDQCVAAGVPFHFKQWGAWWPQECNPIADQRFAERLRVAGITPDRTRPARGCWCADGVWRPGGIAGGPGAYTSWKIGKKAAGRLLDGVEWNQFPEALT